MLYLGCVRRLEGAQKLKDPVVKHCDGSKVAVECSEDIFKGCRRNAT